MTKDKIKNVPESVYKADRDRAAFNQRLAKELRAMIVLRKEPGPTIKEAASNFLAVDDLDDTAVIFSLNKIVEKLDKFAGKVMSDPEGAPISLLRPISDAGLQLRGSYVSLKETLSTLDQGISERLEASINGMVVAAFLIGKRATLERAQYESERLRRSSEAGKKSGKERVRSADKRWREQAFKLARECLGQRGRRYPSQDEIADYVELHWPSSAMGEHQKPGRSSIKRIISIWQRGGEIISKADWKNLQ